jgi:hypothetical protein
MDILDRLRLGQDQQVVVALLRQGIITENARMAGTTGPMRGEITLGKAQSLNLRAHRPVKDQYAISRRSGDPVEGGGFRQDSGHDSPIKRQKAPDVPVLQIGAGGCENKFMLGKTIMNFIHIQPGSAGQSRKIALLI